MTNLDYAQHRWYSSQIDRFTTVDPKPKSANAQIPQSWNRYTYALGDPVNKSDPTGLEEGEELTCYGYGMWWSSDVCDLAGGPRRPSLGVPWDSTKSYPLGQAEQLALLALRGPKCAGIFNTDPNRQHNFDPASVLASMIANKPLPGSGAYFGMVTTGRIGLDEAAVSKPGNDSLAVPLGNGDFRALTVNIVLQNNGLGTPYWSSSVEDLAGALLHELGHVFNEVQSLGGSAIVYDNDSNGSMDMGAEAQNAATIKKNCNLP